MNLTFIKKQIDHLKYLNFTLNDLTYLENSMTLYTIII